MTTPQNLETIKRIQTTIATAYTSMGLWCLLHPLSVLSLSLAPSLTHQIITPTSLILTRCFGAQAATAGLLLGTSKMDAFAFKVFGWGMVPYFWFNWWGLGGNGKGIFTNWLWMDFVGNTIFASGSAYCVYLLTKIEEEQKGSGKGVKRS